MGQLADKYTDEEIDDMMFLADADEDGKVSYEELAQMLDD